MYICSPMIALLVSNFHKPRNMYIKYANVCVSHSVVSDSLQPHGLYFCQWNSPGKNTGVGCHLFLPGDLPDPGIEARSPALQVDSLPLGHLGSPNTQILHYNLCKICLPQVDGSFRVSHVPYHLNPHPTTLSPQSSIPLSLCNIPNASLVPQW